MSLSIYTYTNIYIYGMQNPNSKDNICNCIACTVMIAIEYTSMLWLLFHRLQSNEKPNQFRVHAHVSFSYFAYFVFAFVYFARVAYLVLPAVHWG